MAYILKATHPVLARGVHRITSDFGKRSFLMNGQTVTDNHLGIDITGDYSNKIDDLVAFADGTVVAARDGISGYTRTDPAGNYVYIDHGNGYQTRYLHMAKGSLKVKKGQTVKAGDVIGRIGATGYVTGAHLHFEVRKGGTAQNPAPYLSGEKVITAPKAETSTGKTYTVQKGDSWWKIAEEQLGSGSKYKELAELNGKSVNDVIHPGDVLILSKEAEKKPTASKAKTYTVKKGDSWWRIAEQQLGKGSLYKKLQAANPGKTNLYPGDVVNIPEI